MRFLFTALVVFGLAHPVRADAQTGRDTTRAADVRAGNDSVRKLLARVDSIGAAGILTVHAWTDSVRKLLVRVDSLLSAALVVPNGAPVAVFTVICAPGACTFSALGSTDDHGIASYRWTTDDSAYAPVSGLAHARTNPSLVAKSYHETLTVTDTAGLAGSLTLPVSIPGMLPIPPPSSIALPEAPRDTVPVTFPLVTGTSRAVHAGGNLQAALNAAVRGDEIVLDAGATFTGNFVLPAKGGTGVILIRSSQLGAIPAGQRVAPADSAAMPRIVTSNTAAALATFTSGSAGGYYMAGLNVTTTCCTDPVQNYGILLLGDGSSAQNTLALMPSDLVLDRMFVHGSPTSNTSRCIGYNAGRTAIFDSYIFDCHGKGFDAQAIGGWNGTGPLRVSNNMLAGSGENVLIGGADPAIPNAITSDATFNRNTFYTPISWKGKWTKKNLFELKNAVRVEVKNSTFNGSWVDGQTGGAWALKTVNQSGRCTWCATTDVWFHDNIVRNAANLLNTAGNPDNAYQVGSPLKRVLIEQVIFEDSIGVAPYTGDPRFWLLLGAVNDLTLRNVTMTSTAACNSFLSMDIGSKGGPVNVSITNNIFSRCQYGLLASSMAIGAPSLGIITGVREFLNNTIIGASNGVYPATTTFVPSLSAAAALLSGRGANRARVAAAVAGIP